MEKIGHFNKAQHNEKFFNHFDVDKTEFRDWVVVGIFYAAIHYYEAYFARYGKHSYSHEARDEWIGNDSRIGDTYTEYRELKQYRRLASYKDKNFTPADIRNFVLPKFNTIKVKLLSAIESNKSIA